MKGDVCVAVLCASLAAVFLSVYLGHVSTQEPRRLLSRLELSLCDGREGSNGLYVAILGQVFDVQTGQKHYGPGAAYHVMAGDDSLSYSNHVKCLITQTNQCVNIR